MRTQLVKIQIKPFLAIFSQKTLSKCSLQHKLYRSVYIFEIYGSRITVMTVLKIAWKLLSKIVLKFKATEGDF